MTVILEVPDGVSGYRTLVEYVIAHGEKRSPRGVTTRDVGWVTLEMQHSRWSLPLGTGRRPSRRIAATETLQLIGGYADHDRTAALSPFFASLREPSGRFHGAYGDRVRDQVGRAVAKLRRDPDTRQAVVTLWDPWLDNMPDKKDYPCTIAIGFERRERPARLEMNVTMRSQDVWLGTPYDIFQFSQLQQTVAACLQLETGVYRHTTWSTHIYESDVASVKALCDPPEIIKREWQPPGLADWGARWCEVVESARRLLFGGRVKDPNRAEEWYAAQLAAVSPTS